VDFDAEAASRAEQSLVAARQTDVRQMLNEEQGKLRTIPDLDPVRRIRALAELMKDRRAIEVHNRLVAKGLRGFDFAAMLEAAWKPAQPENREEKTAILGEQGTRSMPQCPPASLTAVRRSHHDFSAFGANCWRT
jgi:hypothetical protein